MATSFYVQSRTLSDRSKVYDVMADPQDSQPINCIFEAESAAQAEQVASELNAVIAKALA